MRERALACMCVCDCVCVYVCVCVCDYVCVCVRERGDRVCCALKIVSTDLRLEESLRII